MEKVFNRIAVVWVPALAAILVLVYFVPEQRTEGWAILHYFAPIVIAILTISWTLGVVIAAARKPLARWWRAEIFVPRDRRRYEDDDQNRQFGDAGMAARGMEK